MAHTPGPWKAVEIDGTEYQVGASPQTPQYDHVQFIGLARVDSWDGEPPVEQVAANAHLIAAAPDLLAACKEISADLRDRIEDGARFNPGTLSAIAKVNAAIAKAEPTP